MKKMLYLGLLILIAFNVYLNYKQKKFESLIAEFSSIVAKEKFMNERLKSQISYCQEVGNTPIPDVIIKQSFRDSCMMSSLFRTKNEVALCYRFKETHCDACIKDACGLIEDISTKWPCEIYIFTNYKHVTQFAAFSNSVKNKDIVVCNVESLPWQIERADEPYFFVIQNNAIHDIFIHLKENQKENKKYFNNLIKKYK